MKRFVQGQIEEALEYAAAGGQALHRHQMIVDYAKAPSCFVREVEAGRDIAHLFDQDEVRLIATARKLGVKVILVERRGQPSQHIDLCMGPLRGALGMCMRDLAAEKGLVGNIALHGEIILDDGVS